ncbi:hypothetical protein Tco_1174361 [Tanacetum coccineum]
MQAKQTALQYPRFTKLIIMDLMEKYPSIPKRLNEPYNSIKDYTPLCHMYTTREVIVRAIEILDNLGRSSNNSTKLVESTQGTTRTPNHKLAKKNKKGKQSVGESNTPKKSLKIRIKQRKYTPTAPLPPLNDVERDNLIEATQLSLDILEEDVEKQVEGEEEYDDDEFMDIMILSYEDSSTRLELRSHKENSEEIVFDDDKHDDAKNDDDDNDDDDDHNAHALIITRRMGSSEIRTK